MARRALSYRRGFDADGPAADRIEIFMTLALVRAPEVREVPLWQR